MAGHPPTPASDVFATGALLYELVTGRWPMDEPADEDEEEWNEWDDDEDVPRARIAERTPTSDRELTARELEQRYPQIKQPPVPPRAHVPGLPRDLETVVLRALHADPSERYQTVSGMLAALAPILKGRHRMWPENAPVERRADTESR